MNPSDLAGIWTYRSFVNQAEQIGGDQQKALALIFGEGKLTIGTPTGTLFRSVLDFGGGAVMDLYGEIVPGSGLLPDVLIITGTGRESTSTDKWVYQYKGYVVPQWSEGMNQVPVIVGTVIRTIPHGGGKAGLVASFAIVRN